MYPSIKVYEPMQLMGFDITVDYDREYIIGVSYVYDYKFMIDDLAQKG